MNDINNTLFLRLEGPLQAWGLHESKFAIRRIMKAPTKSGIIGLLFATMGISRADADANNGERLKQFASLKIAIRIDRSGIRWWDYHTIGAGMSLRIAKGEFEKRVGGNYAVLSRREFLCDASFLVAIIGQPELIEQIHKALLNPVWTPYLGRKCCPPSIPIYNKELGHFQDLESALCSIPWRPRYKQDKPPETLECLLDWTATEKEPIAPDDAEIWYDVPDSLEWPSHHPRFVIRKILKIGTDVKIGEHLQNYAPSPERPRTDYDTSTWGKVRKRRLDLDNHLCVFCKSPATTVQHVNYRQSSKEANLLALGDEKIMMKHLENHRALCRLCHDAVTMLEYGEDMGLDRINPEDPKWRDRIILKRKEIIEHRSLKTRNRKLSGEEV
jgi:CRISPR system Cascade subunit CasD